MDAHSVVLIDARSQRAHAHPFSSRCCAAVASPSPIESLEKAPFFL
jgi:hypothetical protein